MYGLAGLREVLLQKNFQSKTDKARAQKEDTGILRARVSGDYAYVNGRGYRYTLAVDINIHNGQYVWCELCGNQAVSVGA